MATIITRILRRTPMLYRSRAIISNYKRTQPIRSNVSPRVLFRTFTYQNTEKHLDDNTTETSNTQTVNQLKQMENLTLDANASLTLTLCHLLDQLQIEEAINAIKSNETKVDVDQLLCSLLVVLRRFDERSPLDAFVELVCRIKERSGNKDLVGQILIETVTTNGQTIHAPILIRLLKQFCAIGTKIPITTFNQLLLHVQNNLPNESHKTITRWLKKICDKTAETEPEPIDISRDPESMTSGELESHLIELQSKNLDCRAVLRQLLTLLVFMEKYDRAVEIHQLCKQNKVVFSPEMLFIRLNLMIRTKNLSEAEKTFNQLKRKHISVPIDESLVVDLASLMIENGQIERAKEILKFRAIGRLSGGAHCHRNVCELLLNVAALSAKNGSSVNQSEEFLQFLTKLGYCSFHNTLKGPIIREYLLKNEIGNAMAEFGKLKDETCREIPMHFELTTALIKLSNIEDGSGPISSVEAKEMLDKVTKTVASVHGKRNADVSLILAVAKVGTVAQLRKLLSEAKFNAEFLVNQSEFLDNAEATLFKVVKCSRGLSRLSKVLKEEDLYNSLLKKYIKENNVSAASALLDRMTKDKNIRLAKEFFESMAHMFRQNHFELPTELQMHLRKS